MTSAAAAAAGNASAKPPTSAPPPLHSVAFILTALTLSLRYLPSLASIDHVAKIETFTTPVLPEASSSGSDGMSALLLLPPSPLTIGLIRLSFSAFIFGFAANRFLGPGYSATPTYRPNSRLKSASIKMKRWRVLGPYTFWSWLLLGLSFLLSASISLMVATGTDPDRITPWLPRLALLTFEVSAPNAFLVATVVKYALWPHALKSRGREGTAVFRSTFGLASHNSNVIMVLVEICLLGGLPVTMSHMALAPLFGIAYVTFAWTTACRWAPDRGPQFFYFFLDTTLGWTATAALLGLVVVLLVFYAIISFVDDVLEHMGGGVGTHLLSVVVASSLVCRFRD